MKTEIKETISDWLKDNGYMARCTCKACVSNLLPDLKGKKLTGIPEGFCVGYTDDYLCIVQEESILVATYSEALQTWIFEANYPYNSFEELQELLSRTIVEKYRPKNQTIRLAVEKQPGISQEEIEDAWEEIEDAWEEIHEERRENLKSERQLEDAWAELEDEKDSLEEASEENDLENSMWEDVPPEIRKMAEKAGIGIEDLSNLVLSLTSMKNEGREKEYSKTIDLISLLINKEVELAKINSSKEIDLTKYKVRMAETHSKVETRNAGDIEISRIRWENTRILLSKIVSWTVGMAALSYIAHIAASALL